MVASARCADLTPQRGISTEESFEKGLSLRAQIDLQAPCAAVLLDEVPIRVRDRFWFEQRFSSGRFVPPPDLRRVDHAIDDYMRDVNSPRPKFDCERFCQPAHGEFCAAECYRAAAPTHRGSRSSKKNRAPLAFEHIGDCFPRAEERAHNCNPPRLLELSGRGFHYSFTDRTACVRD